MNQHPDRVTQEQDTTPKLTSAPVALAMGVTMAAWGILTHWVMSLAGGCLFGWALWKWMSEICQEWRQQDER